MSNQIKSEFVTWLKWLVLLQSPRKRSRYFNS